MARWRPAYSSSIYTSHVTADPRKLSQLFNTMTQGKLTDQGRHPWFIYQERKVHVGPMLFGIFGSFEHFGLLHNEKQTRPLPPRSKLQENQSDIGV